jgi:hypothetical protein
MDDSTKKVLMTLATGAVKKVLLTAGAAATTHGLIADIPAETYTAGAVFIVSAGWSFWNDYGKAIILSQLEVLKARSLASAKKIHDAGLKSVTVAEIAAQSPTLTEAQVTKVASTLPPSIQATVVPTKAVA